MTKYTERVLWWFRNDERAKLDVRFFLDPTTGVSVYILDGEPVCDVHRLALALESYATVLHRLGSTPAWSRFDQVEWDTIAFLLAGDER